MTSYNKIVIASQLFQRAHEQFEMAKTDIDYGSSLLLSGAVVGIIAPVLSEIGSRPMHDILADIANVISDSDSQKYHSGLFRAAYNSLKHAGNERRKVAPSDDLEFETDLRLEAAHMLDVAKSDFKELRNLVIVREQCSKEFIEL
jgi:hypothetical protein